MTRICDVCDLEHPLEDFEEPDAHVCGVCKAAGIEIPSPSQRFLAELEENRLKAAYVVEVQATIARRTLARRRLLQFVKTFKPKYIAGWVHEDIARRLERFMRDVEEGKSPRLLLCMPPRHGKSELTSRNFPPWVLGHHPEWEIIAASHTQSLAMSFSRYIRDTVRDPAYTAIFPDTKLDPDSQSVENWNTVSGGGYLAAGVGTGITGRGAHILIIDDPVKDMEAADSTTIRDNTWEWYLSTAYTRLAPGGGVLGILTLWNEDDWGGRIIEQSEKGDGDKFEIVRYPAINDEGDEYLLADDTIVQVAPGLPVPEEATLLRPHNTALHEARYNLEYLKRIKRAYYATGQQRIWSALYQQKPTPDDGVYFTKPMFKYGQFEKRLDWHIYQAWDFAITEKNTSDWNVCTTIAQTPEDDIIVLGVRRFKTADGIGLVDAILDEVQVWSPNFLGVEDGQIWKSLVTLFQRRCQERKLYPNYEVLTPLTDKMVRAGPLRGRMQMGKVYFNKDLPAEVETELLHFPGGKHDDIVDSLAWSVRLALNHAAPTVKTPAKHKSWKDKLPGLMAGQGGTHMSA